jgi:hypothetical protein
MKSSEWLLSRWLGQLAFWPVLAQERLEPSLTELHTA